jgi:hypothetical protein
MEKYVLEALAMMGADSLALSRMKNRYATMVNGPYTTLWEVWNGLSEGTINHGWNAPNTILSQYIAGVSPAAPGWTSYHVLPRMGDLTAISQTVPSVRGDITVIDSLSTDRSVMRLGSPAGTKALIGIPKKRAWQSVTANGRPVWNRGMFLSGAAGIAGAGEDSLHIKFTVDPGDWRFEARTTPVALGDSPVSAAPAFGFARFRKTPRALEVSWNGYPDFTAQLFDPLGQRMSGAVRSSAGRASIPGHSLPEGVYYVRITAGKSVFMRRIALTR